MGSRARLSVSPLKRRGTTDTFVLSILLASLITEVLRYTHESEDPGALNIEFTGNTEVALVYHSYREIPAKTGSGVWEPFSEGIPYR
jgi:hypothetical protein